ncbi:dihydropteroate synthase [Brevibacillus daliensis]|uniref:dihydropteroate synthase n=1 Tax=Brevibacillus daliensis TaxID=2892995 RepID=UPI001E356677|nr:dihydropteroate synthase [Brevibacillus daliensis]
MKHNSYMVLSADIRNMAVEFPTIRVSDLQTMAIRVENIPFSCTWQVKESIQLAGGKAFISKHESESACGLLVASKEAWSGILKQWDSQNEMISLSQEISEILQRQEKLSQRERILCKNLSLPLQERTLIMGILNVTPDSFSDGGKFTSIENAMNHARKLVADGADIIDIGGESTRPGSAAVSLDEELTRVLPIIERLSKEIEVPISIDTYKAQVAKEAINAGAHIINDVWGAKRDPLMPQVAAEVDVPIILMHNRVELDYTNYFADYMRDLQESVQLVREAGVREENIILDPGIGFAKNLQQNLETMRRLEDLVALGYPVLLATSRKSMIGKVLDLPVDERVEGTAATVALGIEKGCHIVRVHDVAHMKRVATMMDAMKKGADFHG